QQVGRQIAEQLGATFNRALENSSDPQALITAFTSKTPSLTPGLLEVVRSEDVDRLPPAPVVSSPLVPAWFAHRIANRENVDRFPLQVGRLPAAYLIYVSESGLDVYEKWIGFLAIGALALLLVALCCGLAYWNLGLALRPLHALASNL